MCCERSSSDRIHDCIFVFLQQAEFDTAQMLKSLEYDGVGVFFIFSMKCQTFMSFLIENSVMMDFKLSSQIPMCPNLEENSD